MNFQDYLDKTIEITNEELEVLDLLSSKEIFSNIELRAAKNSMQVIVENSIGKAKRILKTYNCPVIPQSGRDSINFLLDLGLIEDETASGILSAIGLRNAMIHDYMNFNNEILFSVIHEKKYQIIIDFLYETPNYSKVQLHRIENYFLS